MEGKSDFMTIKGQSNFVYWLIAVLLVALIASNVHFATLAQQVRQVQVERIEERQAIYDEHARQLQAWLAREDRTIAGAFDSYHADAYNPNVERIAEQQLLAAEYQLVLLQVIARQNAVMIELMLVEP